MNINTRMTQRLTSLNISPRVAHQREGDCCDLVLQIVQGKCELRLVELMRRLGTRLHLMLALGEDLQDPVFPKLETQSRRAHPELLEGYRPIPVQVDQVEEVPGRPLALGQVAGDLFDTCLDVLLIALA